MTYNDAPPIHILVTRSVDGTTCFALNLSPSTPWVEPYLDDRDVEKDN